MNYHGKGMFQWDTWYCKRRGSEEVHAFYIQQARPDGGRSQAEADSIGHAVSTNLLDWEELPAALMCSAHGELGDLQSWTGSTIEKDGQYYLFYTIRSSQSQAKHQMIGLAISDDLIHWEKYEGNPVISPDGRWYNTIENPSRNDIVDCRDLMVVKHPSRTGYWGVFATRIPTDELPQGAVFGGAYSDDLYHWEQTAPVYRSTDDRYAIVEMPDLFCIDGKWYLTFLEDTAYSNREILGTPYLTSGTVYAVSDNIEGPYIMDDDNILLASMGFNGFSLRTVDFHGKKYALYSSAERQGENEFKQTFGALSLPKEVRIIDGKLCLCFADLILQKVIRRVLCPDNIPQRMAFQNMHESLGNWTVQEPYLCGSAKSTWARYVIDADVENMIYTAVVQIKSGVGAGLCFRMGGNKAGLVVLLDVEKQLIGCYTLPRFQAIDMRPLPLKYNHPYSLRIITNSHFVEVYVDEILILQFVQYFSAEGRPGMLIDRAEAFFTGACIEQLDID